MSKPAPAHSAMVASGQIRRKSKLKSPVKTAWEIYGNNPGLQRKDAINLALKAGLAFYTARTQYQAWKSAGDHDREAAERSTQLMARLGFKPHAKSLA